jgi:iron complex outermembrane recepter protein
LNNPLLLNFKVLGKMVTGIYFILNSFQLVSAAENLTTQKSTKPVLQGRLLKSPEKVIILEPLTVFATPESPALTVPSLEESQDRLNQVPGGTTLIQDIRIKEGAVFTASDALAYAPGVYVGESNAGVSGGSRISMRGSDINSSIIPISGIKFLRNGLPFTNANGFTDTETLNLNAIQQIEVYRGANAMEYGGSNLGGAINLLTPTGYSADRVKLSMTFGSNGYVNPALSGGSASSNGWDAFASFSYVDFNGNRQNGDQEIFYGYGNLGYRWNANHETRLHIDIQDINFHLSQALTRQQLDENPHQTNLNRTDPASGFPVYRIDLQHAVQLDGDDKFNFGLYYFNKENNYNFQNFGFLHDLWQDAGFSWRHLVNRTLFNFEHRIIWGGLVQWLWINDLERESVDGKPGPIRFNERDDWNNIEAYIEDLWRITKQFTLVLGGQINYRSAAIERKFPALEHGQTSPAKLDFFNFNPKLGFTWQLTPDAQIYGNVSRSAEPSPVNDLINIFQTPKLTSQTATTIEVGARGGNQQFKWDLTFYHAWLNHELLTLPMPPWFVSFTSLNARNTEHTGIELGIESTLPINLLSTGDQIRLRGSYTWNCFEFTNDPQLHNNRMPGIPEHNGRFEIQYQHPSGLYLGPNLTAVSSNWADFSNTLAARPYVLFGARLGWDDKKHWKFFIDGRNLTNEYYAASVFVTGNASNPDPFGRNTALFNPGPTRMVFAGFEYRY